MSTQPPEAPPPPAHEPPTPEDGNSGADPAPQRTRRRMYIAATAVGGAFVLILLAFALGAASQNDSSSSSSSSSPSDGVSSRSAQGCYLMVTDSVDRALATFYGGVETSYTKGNSYYPGYYPYSYDSSTYERSLLVSVYREGSAEVRAFDAGIAEANYWHTSGGAYTYNTMIDRYANQVSSICNASYDE